MSSYPEPDFTIPSSEAPLTLKPTLILSCPQHPATYAEFHLAIALVEQVSTLQFRCEPNGEDGHLTTEQANVYYNPGDRQTLRIFFDDTGSPSVPVPVEVNGTIYQHQLAEAPSIGTIPEQAYDSHGNVRHSPVPSIRVQHGKRHSVDLGIGLQSPTYDYGTHISGGRRVRRVPSPRTSPTTSPTTSHFNSPDHSVLPSPIPGPIPGLVQPSPFTLRSSGSPIEDEENWEQLQQEHARLVNSNSHKGPFRFDHAEDIGPSPLEKLREDVHLALESEAGHGAVSSSSRFIPSYGWYDRMKPGSQALPPFPPMSALEAARSHSASSASIPSASAGKGKRPEGAGTAAETPGADSPPAMALAELPGDTPTGTRSGSGSSGGIGTPTILVSDANDAEGSDRAKAHELARRLAFRTILRMDPQNDIPRSPPRSAPGSGGRSRATSSVSPASGSGSPVDSPGVTPWYLEDIEGQDR